MLSSRALDGWLKSVWRLVPLPSVWPVKRIVLTTAAFLALCVIELSELMCSCCSVAQLCPTLCNSMDCSTPGFLVLHYIEFAQTHIHWGWWCHPTMSSSVIPFSCLQSFPASWSFPLSQFFASRDQGIGASASASVLPVNIQWFPLGSTDLLSLLSR